MKPLHRKVIVVALLLAAVLAVAGYRYCLGRSWTILIEAVTPVYATEEGAGYRREPPLFELAAGQRVDVVWDTYGKDYWVCYVRTGAREYGWMVCEREK